MPSPPTTFAHTLSRRLSDNPGQPLITFYDHATDERVELSVTTYANWVAKAASLLVDEIGLERGDSIRIDLPPHWLGPVFLGAAWTAGLVVTGEDAPDAIVCGPRSLARWAPEASERAVLACALLPLGVRFAEPVPAGVHDVGVEIWSQPDAFVPWDPPGPDDVAVRRTDGDLSQAALLQAAAGGALLDTGGRLLSVADPVTEIGTFTEPLCRDGSVVLVAHPDRERLEATSAAERTSARFPG